MKTQTAIIKVKVRDNYSCQECGSREKIQGHHKIKNDDDSLITLCALCHSKSHPDMPQALFLNSNHVTEPKLSMLEISNQYGITSKPALHSILHQMARGTYERNQQIRILHKSGENMAQIGRWFKISRQAVRDIVKQAGGD
ncbi:hypothetical protein LCGC14_0791080 [marine sediment metagenome]|uniref:HNH nuclease domain-containing protein n=1 Tax=marine sediment metagenome TaxID=412755 RepID=A0A0F9SCE7_9ZZZZ